MTPRNHDTDERDEVLYAFHLACERPNAAQITEWAHRYPHFADDIRAHAAVARDWSAREGTPAPEPDESLFVRGHSRVLNALFNAANAAVPSAAAPGVSFHELMSAKGTDVPRLARELNIGRSVLADLFNGGMLAPVGLRLVQSLTTALEIAPAVFDAASHQALLNPRLGHAKADGTPLVIARPYEEVIRTSGMSVERIRYWLGED